MLSSYPHMIIEYTRNLTDEQKKTLEEAGKILRQAGFTFFDLQGFSLSGGHLQGFSGEPEKLLEKVEALCRFNRLDLARLL